MSYRLILTSLFAILLSACSASPHKDGSKLIELKKAAQEKYQAGDYLAAKNLFAELVKKYPRDEDGWFRLGNCHARLKQPDAAIYAYREALVRNPRNSKVWYNLAYIQASALGKTVSDMVQYVDPADPNIEQIKELTEAVIKPFEILNAPQEIAQ